LDDITMIDRFLKVKCCKKHINESMLLIRALNPKINKEIWSILEIIQLAIQKWC